MASNREKELEAIVRELVPAARDILWCALVWNDHNFSYDDLRDKALRAGRVLGFNRSAMEDGVGKVNEWLDRVDRALKVVGNAQPQESSRA